MNKAKVCVEIGNKGVGCPSLSVKNLCKICQGRRYMLNEVGLKLASSNRASLFPSSVVEGAMAVRLELGPCPETMFGICRPVNEINDQPAHF